MTLQVFSALLILTASMVDAKTDRFPECGRWAQEGECRNNPKFMLDSCSIACFDEMKKNTNEHCMEWADQEECTRNPGFMLLHCSGACGMSSMWSPFARQALGLEHHEVKHEHSNTIQVDNVALDATMKMGNRLRQLFVENLDTFSLSSDVWMLSASLGEAMLYTVNSAAIASRGIEGNYGDEIRSAALAIKDRIQTVLQRGPDLFHRYASLLYEEIDRDVLHPILSALAHVGPDNCAAVALYDQDARDETIDDTTPVQLPESQNARTTEAVALLRGGDQMPAIGFGTCWLTPEETYHGVLQALNSGVRHIDTAEAYRNEEAIGRAIVDSRLRRDEIYVATKISSGESHGYEQTRALVERQLRDLQTSYIDLYYIHGYPQAPHDERFSGTWRALEELVSGGVIKHLGVSNYNEQLLRSMFEGESASLYRVKPSVIQNKFEPFHQGDQLNRAGVDMVALSKHYQVAMVGYSTLRGWPLSIAAVEDPHVEAIAERTGKSPSQVLLRWALQCGISVIPRSKQLDHIAQNADLLSFELTHHDMRTINALEHMVNSPMSRPRRAESDHFGLQIL